MGTKCFLCEIVYYLVYLLIIFIHNFDTILLVHDDRSKVRS
jgi:hypothetical protein